MKKTTIIKIMRTAMKLSFTAVLGVLCYIIYRVGQPVTDMDGALFLCNLPEALETVLLCTVIIAGFMTVMLCIFEKDVDL
ncbi:MAG: hypothetical protein IJ386_03755 [Clostridia bacterium]|nr:hypothetical protein [Clostridia bacterium]